MKRIISLCCIALILVTCMAAPVRADEFNNDVFINVLDYNADLFAAQTVSASNPFITFTLPQYTSFSYIDIVFGTSNSNFSSVSVSSDAGTYSLTLLNVGTNRYRAYGNVSVSGSTFNLVFDTSSTIYVNISRCEITRNRIINFDIEAFCDIEAYGYTDKIHYVPTDEINYRIFTGVSTPLDGWMTLYIYTDEWRKYDYIDFQFTLTCANITSVSAIIGNTTLPLDVSIFDNSTWVSNDYFVSMRLDLTGINRSSSDYPMIILEARVVPGESNVVSFSNCSGFLKLDDFDPYFVFFNRIVSSLNNVVTTISSNFDTYFTNLYYWFYEYFGYVIERLDTLTSTISDKFTLLDSWITSQTSRLLTGIDNQNAVLTNFFYYWFGEFLNRIDSQTSKLEAAIRGDTVPGDSFQDEVVQKDQEFNEMAAVMDSVTKPPVDQINVSVDNIVSSADVQLLATPMAVFFDGQIFSQMIVMSILLATVSFVLFGKR